ncbi:MAG TPA: calcium/sodium antiporter [Sedimentisphaerales bacterium]|nr:calcium/sodium antiporter [Sedimentisphaerales bacterium]
MNIVLAVVLLIGGLAILWKCAGLLVTGAVGLAKRLGISSLVVGLTVVAMGTSAPELAASIAGVLRESGGGNIAVGNVFGSNIANLALVGGLVALIRPLMVKKQTLRREIPVMILMALLLWPFLNNSYLSRPESISLLVVFAALILLMINLARVESKHNKKAEADRLAATNGNGAEMDSRLRGNDIKNGNETEVITRVSGNGIKSGDGMKNALFIVIGLVGLAVGAKMAVEGAVFIGQKVGLSESVIGLTIIAFGTSLPELVTCVVAAIKGHHDISVGNLVGSNIFNTLLVVGGAGVVRPFEIGPQFAGGTDYWIMIIVSAAFALAVIIGKRTIGRVSGTLLLCGYVGYLVYLFGFSG